MDFSEDRVKGKVDLILMIEYNMIDSSILYFMNFFSSSLFCDVDFKIS